MSVKDIVDHIDDSISELVLKINDLELVNLKLFELLEKEHNKIGISGASGHNSIKCEVCQYLKELGE